MKLTVKTLKGEKFPIDVDVSSTVAQTKSVIESTKSELAGASMKLIHSGKVLKDEDTLEKSGVKEKDFLVVMATKPKKPAAAPPAAAPATAAPAPAATSTPATPAPAAPPAPAAAAAAPAPAVAETPAPAPAVAETPAAPARSGNDEFPPEQITRLTDLGFPEAEARHCLRAANGNPDIAVEFLTNGIPPGIPLGGTGAAAASPAAGSASSGGAGGPLQSLRNHPQFNDLRRLVQSNPQMLQQVLTQIGQQQPELLQEINSNQAAFLEMMNEPIDETMAPAPAAPAAPAASRGGPMGDPAQISQMMRNMDPAQLQMMANMMGLTPEQIQAVSQAIGQMPPEQLQEYMAQAMGQGGAGMAPPGAIRLTPEEMAAVNRLCDLGFERTEAAQAYLACDKDEQLAANLLLQGGFSDDPPLPPQPPSGGGSGGGGSSGPTGGGDGDDMYD